MKTVCLPKPDADSLKESLKSGKLDLAKLYDMTTKERREAFSKVVDKNMVEFVNTEFERAMASQRTDALKQWLKKTTTEKQRKDYQMIKKIDEAKDIIDNNQFNGLLEDLISDKLGVNVSEKEIDGIMNLSAEYKRLEKEQANLDDVHKIEFFKLRKDLNDYMNGLNPSSELRVMLSTIRRGGMLFGLPGTIVNITSNMSYGAIGALYRRAKTQGLRSGIEDVQAQFVKDNMKLYYETSTDISRMVSLKEKPRIRGEEVATSEGKGAVRAVGRFYERNVFELMQGVPDVACSSIAFADRAGLEANKIARKEGLTGDALKKRTAELFKDATNIDPKLPEARAIRDISMADAFESTYTNKTQVSDLAENVRKAVNNIKFNGKATGLGDVLAPFVKTPSNVMYAGLKMSGLDGIRSLVEVTRGLSSMQKGEIAPSKAHFSKAANLAITQGISTALAFTVAGMLKDSDYMPDYLLASEKEKQLAKQFNIPFNAIKIGDKWLSFDFFGPIAAPVKALIQSRRFGNTVGEKFLQYTKTMSVQLVAFPGLSAIKGALDGAQKIATSTTKMEDIVKDSKKGAVDFMLSTVYPRILSDIAIGLDSHQRTPDTPIEQIMAKIPIVREQVGAKENLFGDEIMSEGFLSSVAFGSRVKTYTESPIYDEMNRLNNSGNMPTIKDIEKTSKLVKELKKNIPKDDFNKVVSDFGKSFGSGMEQMLEKTQYINATDERKKKMITQLKNIVLRQTLYSYQREHR